MIKYSKKGPQATAARAKREALKVEAAYYGHRSHQIRTRHAKHQMRCHGVRKGRNPEMTWTPTRVVRQSQDVLEGR